MRLLSIDPGTTQSAWMVLEDGAPVSFNIVENDAMRRFCPAVEVDHLAIEMFASYGMRVGKECFETCVWIGRFIEAAEIPFTQVYRKDVKLHICQSPRAKDGDIRQALIDRFGGKQATKKGGVLHGVKKDIWSSLAIGTYWFDTQGGTNQ